MIPEIVFIFSSTWRTGEARSASESVGACECRTMYNYDVPTSMAPRYVR